MGTNTSVFNHLRKMGVYFLTQSKSNGIVKSHKWDGTVKSSKCKACES